MDIDITKVTSKGQVVIPQGIREHTGIEEGERFLVYETDDSIVLKRIKNLERIKDTKELERAFASMWKTAKKRGVTKADVEQQIKAARRHETSHP